MVTINIGNNGNFTASQLLYPVGGLAVSESFDPQGCGTRLRIEDLTPREWELIRQAEARLRQNGEANPEARALNAWFAFVQEADCRGITREELTRWSRINHSLNGTDVSFSYEDGCEAERRNNSVGSNGIADDLETYIDSPRNRHNPRQFETTYEELANDCAGENTDDPEPNPGPNGGPNEGNPCGAGCEGGSPNASIGSDIPYRLENPVEMAALTTTLRNLITGGMTPVAETSVPAVAGSHTGKERAVA